jgi:UDP-glucose 4-epimerase
MNVAIVGSNGFVGGYLTKKLLQISDINISLFGKNKLSVFGDELPYCKIDLSDVEQVRNNFVGKDIIYYLASETIPASTWDDPKIEVEKNLLPFLNFIDVIAQLGAKKVIFTSSAGTVYGPSADKLNENAVKNPFSPHGIVKLTMEYFLNYFRLKYGLNSDIYRISNIYGPGQNTKKGLGIINTFLEKIVSENQIKIFGTGETIRNYIYIEDLTELLSRSLFSPSGQSEVYNVASFDTLTINELVKVIRTIVAENFDVIYTETRQSDNPFISLDNTKILKNNPGFQFTDLKNGVLQTYKHIKSNL